jgi:hypothetical protein
MARSTVRHDERSAARRDGVAAERARIKAIFEVIRDDPALLPLAWTVAFEKTGTRRDLVAMLRSHDKRRSPAAADESVVYPPLTLGLFKRHYRRLYADLRREIYLEERSSPGYRERQLAVHQKLFRRLDSQLRTIVDERAGKCTRR